MVFKQLNVDEKLSRYDYVLFVIVFICPYLDSGIWWMITSFIPFLSALGSSFLAFILSLYLFQYSARHYFTPYSKTFYNLVIIAAVWSIIKLLATFYNVGFSEAITIYRRNYILLFSFLLCIRYISSMSTTRLEMFARLVLKWLPVLSLVYLIQCAGINLFNVNIRIETAGDVSVIRNIIGMPPVMPVIFAYCFISYLYNGNWKNIVNILICISVLFFSFTRNLIATAGIIIILSILLYTWKNGLKDKYKLVFYAILIAGIFLIIFPNNFQFWGNLIDSTINLQLVKNDGTYAFREKLIQKALTTLENNQVLWTGLGYIRDTPKGEYGLVLGTDTYIAPILWCEGLLGLIFRCLPCVYLMIKSGIYFNRCYDNTIRQLSLIIFVSILSQIPNYVQSHIFMKYNFTIAMLYMIYVYIRKLEEMQSA